MEERRLQQEQQLEQIRMTMEGVRGSVGQSSQQPIVINNVMPKQGKKVGKVTLDELGNPSIELNNIDEGLYSCLIMLLFPIVPPVSILIFL